LTLCIHVWPEGVLQSINSLIRVIKAKNYKIGRKESGDLGAVFVVARSTVVNKESTFVDCSSGQNGSGIYSDMHSHFEMFGVVFQTSSTGSRPYVSNCSCVSKDWVDSYGDDCKVCSTYMRHTHQLRY